VFEHPWVLLALGLLPLAVFLRRRGWGRPAAVDFPETRSVQGAFQGGRRPGSGLTEILRLAVIALLIVAAARPKWFLADQELTSSGLDVILALDISGSMAAGDFEPLNRLQAAKRVLRNYITQERHNRLGLVAFAARAFMVCPLTLDYEVLVGLLDHLEIGMTTDGTAIGMAIAAGLNRLKSSDAKSKVIILLTDGRNNTGQVDPETAARLAAALKVRIYTIGMGRPGGGSIVVQDEARGPTVLLNEDGSVHTEELDEDILKRLGSLTGGKYFRATDVEKLQAIYDEIAEMERSRLKAKTFRTRRDAGPGVLALAWLLLGLEWLLAQTRERAIP